MQTIELVKNDWLNPRELSEEYGLSVSTLAKWRMYNLNLPYSKIGKFIKYKRADIEAFLSANIIEAVNGGAV